MGGFSNLGSVYVEVGADLSALTKDLQGAVSEAATAGQQIGQSLEQGINSSAPAAASGLHEVAGAASEAESGMEGLGESLGKVAELFGVGLGIAEGVESLKALAEESIDAYGKIQLATVALTALTGSAQDAEEVLASMKQLALGSIFSLPELATAAQQLANIGVAAQTIPPAMKAIVDAAEGSGKSLDAVSSAFDRIVNTGQISSRTLNQLGVSMADLSETTGMTSDEVTKAFKEMGPGSADSLNILIATIERLKASAGDNVVGTLPQQINAVKVQWDSLLESLGGAVAGPLGTLLTSINSAIATFTAFGEALKSIGGGGGILTTIFPQIQIVGQAWGWFKDQVLLATAAIDTATGKYSSFGAALDDLTKKTAGVTTATQASKDAEDLVNAALAGSIETAQKAAAADENRKALKEALTSATTAASAAEKSLAEDMRALSIPAVKDLATAEADVVTARTALATADGIEQTALAAMNAERDKAVPNAQVLKQLETDLKNASTESTLARQSLKDAEAALTLTRTTAKEVAAQLSQDEQAHATYLKATAVPTIMDYKTALDAVNTAKQAAAQADANLTIAEMAYNAAVKSGDTGAIATATLNLSAARAKLKTDTDAIKTSEDNLKKSQDAVTAATKEIQTIDKALDDFYLREMTPHLTDLTAALTDVNTAKQAAVEASDNLRQIENELQSAILQEGDATKHVTDLRAQAAAALQDFTNKTKSLHDIEQIVAADFGITVGQLRLLIDAQTPAISSTQLLGDAYAALGIKTQSALQAAAQAAQIAYNAIAADANASLSQQLQALEQLTAAQIAAGQAIPADQQIQLAKMEQQEKDYISNSAKRWTDLSNSIHDDLQGMFGGLITDLFTGGDFVKTMEDTLNKIGEQIVSAIFKPFTDLISQTISSLITPLAKTLAGWISDALSVIFPGLAGALGAGLGASATVANTAAVTANTAALGALTAAMGAGTAAGAAGSAAGGAGGAGGAIGQAVGAGLAATVSAITGVVSAVTGVISVFQQARQENTLNAIEQNTRDSAFYLGGNNSGGGILQAVYHMDENLQYGYIAKDVRDIHDKFMGTGPAQSEPNADLLKAIGNLDTDLQYGFISKNVLDIRDKIMTFADGGGSMSMRGSVYLDSKELFSSFVSWAEDNGLVIPQS